MARFGRSAGIGFGLRRCVAIVAASFSLAPFASADIGVAVLDFELHDLTLTPGIPEEMKRVAGLRTGLAQALRARGDYRIVEISAAAQAKASPGSGYLADHPELAAALADPAVTDYVVVGTLTKPTFLFSYLQARLVRVRDRAVVDDIQVEIKGQADKVTPHGLAALAERLDAGMRQHGAR